MTYRSTVLFVGGLFAAASLTRLLARPGTGWAVGPAMLAGSAVLLLVVSVALRRRLAVAVLPRFSIRHPVRIVVQGVLLGIGLFVVGGLGYSITEAIGISTSPPSAAPGPVPFLVLSFGATAILEELAFRGVLLDLLRGEVGGRWSVAIQAGLFSAYHLSPGQLLSALAYGLILGSVTVRDGHLARAVLAHLTLNALGLALFLASAGGS